MLFEGFAHLKIFKVYTLRNGCTQKKMSLNVIGKY